jgi:hypothetical protein
MARYTKVIIQCDACLEQNVETAGEEYRVGIGNARPRMVALCEEHHEEVLSPVLRLFDNAGKGITRTKAGKRSEAPSSASEPLSCPEEGCDFTTNPTLKRPQQGLAMHKRRVHGG